MRTASITIIIIIGAVALALGNYPFAIATILLAATLTKPHTQN